MKVLRIGTRKSKLALRQTEIVCEAIKSFDSSIKIEIVPMLTKGDKIQDVSLLKIGGKGVFTKELEEALLLKKIDLAVHSAKDLPLESREGLSISPILEREDARDVFISLNNISLKNLEKGSVVGTSSLRRNLQAKKINPLISIKDLRGNIQTRLDKLKSGEYTGIILAGAGIKRLIAKGEDLSDFYIEYLEYSDFLPAAAQGILAIEYRENDLSDLVKALKNEETSFAFDVERSFLHFTEAGCNAPCGIYLSKKDMDIYNVDLVYEYKDKLEYKNLCFKKEKIFDELKKLAISIKEKYES